MFGNVVCSVFLKFLYSFYTLILKIKFKRLKKINKKHFDDNINQVIIGETPLSFSRVLKELVKDKQQSSKATKILT
jgi:hypothetical protein